MLTKKHPQLGCVEISSMKKLVHPPKSNIDTKNDGLEKVVPALNMAIFGIYSTLPKASHSPAWPLEKHLMTSVADGESPSIWCENADKTISRVMGKCLNYTPVL